MSPRTSRSRGRLAESAHAGIFSRPDRFGHESEAAVDRVRVNTGRVDEIAARFAARGGQPGLAYGIVDGGELAHAGGAGESFTGGGVPGPDTVFRIASMTKSFTASAVMLLREDGVLALDDPAHRYLPVLRGVQLPAADCRPVTIRQLLTMTAGFPTDDPWGDRQQGLPLAAFDELVAGGGVRCCWAPGTRFEYSNLGYALLGRIIAAVTGGSYETAIRQMLLAPLGLDRTGFEAGEFGADDLARGYQRDETGWRELQPDPSGAFSSMGGVFSCVRDLARWVAGFAAAFPARSGPAGDHPLARSARREMQIAHVAIPAGGTGPATRFTGPAAIGYGFGLYAEDDLAFGPIVQHGGGYPGYGSHMRWHPATGIGAIVLANSTYAAAGALAGELLADVLGARPAVPAHGYRMRGSVPAVDQADTGDGPAAARPWPETIAARNAVNGLLLSWDDAVAARLFTPNVAQDRPLPRRRADIGRLRERIGEFRPDPGQPAECDSPAHCRWWLVGEHGRANVQIRLAPLREPLVQQLVLAVPAAPDSALGRAVAALVATLNAGATDWPGDLETTADGDRILRELRLAAAWTGRCEPGGCLAGDGTSSTTIELTGPDGAATLTVDVGGPDSRLQRAEVALLP
jgi:CubicO group peptidase (beta-lactamase class C family)